MTSARLSDTRKPPGPKGRGAFVARPAGRAQCLSAPGVHAGSLAEAIKLQSPGNTRKPPGSSSREAGFSTKLWGKGEAGTAYKIWGDSSGPDRFGFQSHEPKAHDGVPSSWGRQEPLRSAVGGRGSFPQMRGAPKSPSAESVGVPTFVPAPPWAFGLPQSFREPARFFLQNLVGASSASVFRSPSSPRATPNRP